MITAPIGESIDMASADADGTLCVYLREDVRQRYRQYGSGQDGYVFVIDSRRGLTVKRARKDGKLLSQWERLRYGPRARIAVVSNQPVISSLLPTLIPLSDHPLNEPDAWQLLTFDIEWEIGSTEPFYLHFLTSLPKVTECHALAAMADAIRAELVYALFEGAKEAAGAEVDRLAQAVCNREFIRNVNQRLANTGITVRRFHLPRANEARMRAPPAAAANGLLRLRQAHGLQSRHASVDDPSFDELASALLCHLCQPAKQWLEPIWRHCGFDITYDEICAALQGDTNQLRSCVAKDSTRQRADLEGKDFIFRETPGRITAPIAVVRKLQHAGRTHLRMGNRTPPQLAERRSRHRQKALAFFEFALLLSTSPILADPKSVEMQDLRVELLALMESLRPSARTHQAQIALHPDSTVHLMAVALEPATSNHETRSDLDAALQPVFDILPLTVGDIGDQRELATVWTPVSAAKENEFVGAMQEIDLTLQVLESSPTTDLAGATTDTALFWTWKVKSSHDQFALRLSPTAVTPVYDVELHNAEFIDPQAVRSSNFPVLPSFDSSLNRSNLPS